MCVSDSKLNRLISHLENHLCWKQVLRWIRNILNKEIDMQRLIHDTYWYILGGTWLMAALGQKLKLHATDQIWHHLSLLKLKNFKSHVPELGLRATSCLTWLITWARIKNYKLFHMTDHMIHNQDFKLRYAVYHHQNISQQNSLCPWTADLHLYSRQNLIKVIQLPGPPMGVMVRSESGVPLWSQTVHDLWVYSGWNRVTVDCR